MQKFESETEDTLKDDHSEMADEDLYLKLVMLFQNDDPEAWEVARVIRNRGTIDKARMVDVEHVLNTPKPEKTKAEALLARIPELYADSERAALKDLRSQQTKLQAEIAAAQSAVRDEKDPAKWGQLNKGLQDLTGKAAKLERRAGQLKKMIGTKLASAGKRPA
jgi:hypothetical protein